MRISNLSLYNQISLLLLVVVLVTTGVIQFTAWWSAEQFNNQQIRQDIQKATEILDEYAQSREALLMTSARVLTADFGFKQAVATSDRNTIASMLENHRNRIDADVLLLSQRNGDPIASSSQTKVSASQFREIFSGLNATPEKSQLIWMDNAVYQIIMQPVLAPRPIAYALIGFQVDEPILEKLHKLTLKELTFLVNNEVVTSTLPNITAGMSHKSVLDHTETSWFLINRPQLIHTELATMTSVNNPVSLILTHDLRPIYNQYDALALRIIVIALSIFILAILSGSYLASQLTKPLASLVNLAKQFAQGDYRHAVTEHQGSSETRSLSEALHVMGNQVASREERIRYQAEHDHLTGLFNAEKLRSTLTNTLSELQRAVLITFYIGNFRQVNDRLGPDLADNCLRIIANRIRDLPCPGKHLVARMEGIEFIVIYQLPPGRSEQPLIDQLLYQLEMPIREQEITIHMQYHCGVAVYPDDADEPLSLLRRTRLSADYARSHQLRIYHYEQGLDEARLERFALIESLNLALKQKGKGFKLNFQPKMRILDQQIIGVEALMRWEHPEKGFVPPDTFIALAEQAGLISDITRWVIHATLHQARQWHQRGVMLQVAINVSAEDVCNPAFCQMLENAVDNIGVNPKYCTIEITERDILQDEKTATQTLLSIQNRGFRISLDDYGIGQSALAKLKVLPINEIKLDKAFILNLDTSAKDQSIVRSTITMARELNLKVVAEGVENAASLQLLTAMGCDSVQGYYLGRPMPADQLLLWLEKFYDSDQPSSAGSV
ncbi:diguanylate cyclase/phosphodiesterase (GGDEF & EAL domains) with PAS/PAC sensor(s) [Methylophaga frappieri]|uniref:Diguanylate cyclase/phosphodiesterase (GGDEF & EAL domains) with PAS/PAC sensor(S) n=1 Tax=Methylophaga frappieri (strain ATCC BAA-2434 / DSM 25690 / JAM7) TaxID=754477 RepID=I1YH16_METFJ|nr:EAL domain-containing protein [Methylophaga frappieri]AFJ02209.1 diguanylate cyclase/phosphodiesterase (GGDEF & EAL domains) with PAS/PAC sensor(s) [Methylophaga frappieri]